MVALELLSTAGRVFLLFAGLLGPGALLLRALRLPPSLAGSFIGSAALLYLAVVLLVLAGVPVDLGTLVIVLTLASLAFWVWSRRRPAHVAAPDEIRPGAFLTGLGPWTPLYLAFWAVVAWRFATQPLNGGDIDFRWSWLAEQMLKHGSLDFYPPRTAGDFTSYFWVESIPPGVASLHAWAYACAGGTREVWTSAGGLLQLLALHDLAWRLASHWGGPVAARRAVLLAAAMPMLNWSFLLGQETGLTALAVCGLVFALARWDPARPSGWLGLAALAAVVGASAREYGLVFPLLGFGLLALRRAPRRAWLGFAAVAVPAALVWPVRTWCLTGNPFYSLGAGGVFPVNPLFVDWAASISSGSRHLLSQPADWAELARYFLLCAPAALPCWLAIGWPAASRPPAARLSAAGVLLTVGIWYASLPYTGGGLFYSLRVLSPAFALGAIFGGQALGSRGGRTVDILLGALLVVTLPVSLTLPHNPFHLSPAEWPDAGQRFVDARRHADADLSRQLQSMPGHTRILSECVSLPRSLAAAGITVVPMWSPEVAWLFDRRLAPAEVARHWQQSGLRYVVMTRSPAQLELLSRRAVWLAPFFAVQRAWQSDGYVVLAVTAAPPAR